MKNKIYRACLMVATGLLGLSSNRAVADSHLLWQIGQPDTNNTDFALAPGGWANYKSDAIFAIGESTPGQDWPYVQPGPADAWAGSRPHTSKILFALKTPPVTGECRLKIGLIDTQNQLPPKLRIRINDRDFEQATPPGASDDSLNGQPAKGRPYQFEIAFPSDLLHAGDNDIKITTLAGSWMLYDWIGLETPAGGELKAFAPRTILLETQPISALRDQDGQSFQPVQMTLCHFGEPTEANVRIGDAALPALALKRGEQTVEVLVPAVSQPATRTVTLEAAGQILATGSVTLKPVRKLTVYILPHSHTDIGYTTLQTEIEKKQMNNLLEGIAAARRTADYPAGSRFVWNVEVLWAADLYMHRMNAPQRTDFLEAVKQGWVVLNGMYLNELTGLCRPEDLIQLFHNATRLSEQTGVPVDSAMISDVPGCTWGAVTAMSQAGIKYFSTAPNYFDRIGTMLREWENKPFYWEGPDGQSKVLVWIPFYGYAMSHLYNRMSPKLVNDFSAGLDRQTYPYDIAYLRWSGHGDNAVPDPQICDDVRDWNAKYTWPHFIIAGTGEAFRAFEQRYGGQLPVMRGDWTPYWEDGAGSSARETAMNRQSSDRLVQAETASAMLNPQRYSAANFEAAWQKVLLYSEHTWGAWCSIDQPENKETLEQWKIKKSYADDADRQSRELLALALSSQHEGVASNRAPTEKNNSVEVVNTLSWPRTDLVTLAPELSQPGNRVKDEHGKIVASQRLRSGELVFLAQKVPPLATQRYAVSAGTPEITTGARADGATLDNGRIHVRVDQLTGGIVELTAQGIGGNFANTNNNEALNNYDYLIGDDLKDLKHNGPVRISVGEKGPLVASLIIESDAPGCKTLRRELRVTAGQDYVEVMDLVDKARLQSASYRANSGKESVNFAFPFNVPEGDMLVDIPLGAMKPERDQMPGACKNWLTVGRWVDVSNPQLGITWVTLDAPLIEVGEISARLLNSQTNPNVWRKHIPRTQKFYSWAMNNHWGTNYRAYQEDAVTFRFILRPHRQFDPAEATRFATGFSQPLLARADASQPPVAPLLRVSPADVLVTDFKPSDDGKAWIVRLFGASGKTVSARLNWGPRTPKAVFLSNTSEQAGGKVTSEKIPVPGFGLVTLRAEFE